MTRKIVFSLVVAALLLSSPGALVAQDGPISVEVPIAVDVGAGEDGGEMDRLTAKRTADADPNGQSVKVAEQPAFDFRAWLQVFLSSVVPF